MQDAFQLLLATFDSTFSTFEKSEALGFIRSAQFKPRHYAGILREIYFYTRDNPQLQCAWTQTFSGERRVAVRRVIGHALDEIGHEQLALDDIRALGYDVRGIPEQRMLPSTLPLVAMPAYNMKVGDGIGYLGQLLFLEFMPTRSGEEYLRLLARAGVPKAAMSFLAEHAEVDVHHNRLMERHVKDLVLTQSDLEACQRAIEVTGHFYAHMLLGAITAVESGQTSLSEVELEGSHV